MLEVLYYLPKLSIVFLLLGIFISGAIIGGLLGTLLGIHIEKRRSPELNNHLEWFKTECAKITSKNRALTARMKGAAQLLMED